MKKNVFILIIVFVALFACLTIQNTLAKYRSEVDGNANLAIADQLVLLNRNISVLCQLTVQQQSQRIMAASPSIVKGL